MLALSAGTRCGGTSADELVCPFGGVSISGENALWGASSGGGSEGNVLSNFMPGPMVFDFDRPLFCVFFLRRTIKDSWHSMQKIPCEVRAYRRFSIFFLQLRHRKQAAQKAWSPVKIARSSILLPHAVQLYVQLLQINEPSPSRRRFASESRNVPQVLQRKQWMCHL